MLRFLRYARLRSLYPLLALAAIWGVAPLGALARRCRSRSCSAAPRDLRRALDRAEPAGPGDRAAPGSGASSPIPRTSHGLLFCALHFAAIGSAFWLWLHPEVTGFATPAQKLGFALGAGMWLGWSGGINMGINFHSHAHKPIFRNDALNRWFGRLWTLPGGIPSYWWRYKHLAVHHSHLGRGSTTGCSPSGAPTAATRTSGSTSCSTGRGAGATTSRASSASAPPAVRRRAWRELAIFAVPFSIPFFVDPWMALGLWLFPAWVGGSMIMGMGMYAQHAGGTDEHRYSHTTTFLSHFFNLTMFNAGFHIEHHEQPGGALERAAAAARGDEAGADRGRRPHRALRHLSRLVAAQLLLPAAPRLAALSGAASRLSAGVDGDAGAPEEPRRDGAADARRSASRSSAGMRRGSSRCSSGSRDQCSPGLQVVRGVVAGVEGHQVVQPALDVARRCQVVVEVEPGVLLVAQPRDVEDGEHHRPHEDDQRLRRIEPEQRRAAAG